MRHLAHLALIAGSFLVVAAAPPSREYAEGQVWEYRARPQDKGSLVKIQKVEQLPELSQEYTVYHVTVVGVNFSGLPFDGTLGHLPFSKASLDASLTKLSQAKADFPDATGGIAQWREAKGGIFTITIAEAVSFVEQTLGQQTPAR